MAETLFERLYRQEHAISAGKRNGMKIDPGSMCSIITEERRIVRRLSFSNPLLARVIEGESPHNIVEAQRRAKFSRWLGAGRWLPIGHDKEHEKNQGYLEEIFSNVGHYRARGLSALDNPVTLALYGAGIGFGVDAIPLLQNILAQGFDSLTGSMPAEISMYKELAYTEAGLGLGTLLGYIRRTRKVDWLNICKDFGSTSRARVWDQADYIRFKVRQLDIPIDVIVESPPEVYMVPSNASINERKNAKKNPLFKELGIKVCYETKED